MEAGVRRSALLRGFAAAALAGWVLLGGQAQSATPGEPATVFLSRAETELAQADEANQRAQWVNETYLNGDTNWLVSRSNEAFTQTRMRLAREAAGYRAVDLDPVSRRKLELLAISVRSPAPTDPAASHTWADLQTSMVARFNQHKVVDGARTLGSYGEVRHAMETTSDAAALQRLWRDWHAVGRDVQADYARFVDLSQSGAHDLGFADVGELWRSAYDMPPKALEADTERLWGEIRPLYVQLQCYARAKLSAAYGPAIQPDKGLMRIELTRNPMGMYWVGAYDLIARDLPPPTYDLDKILEQRNISGRSSAEFADRFWSSMGLEPMPETFWTRSMFARPRDRDVVCPGRAFLIDGQNDVRMRVCAGANALDLTTVHHEMGHDVYGRAYKAQPYLFRASANDAFHEAVADLGAVSITPSYLQAVGLIDAAQTPGPDQDLGLLMRMALQRVSFMPFALIVDKWRWQVFSGEVKPDRYDAAWWSLVNRYQGLGTATARPEGAFDIASLPHITGNVSYVRYFYAYLLEFQMLKAACDQAGWKGPLHRCSLYGDKAAGTRLQAMTAMGASQPWPDALEAFTGQRRVSAAGMLAYFKPLQTYLEHENRGRPCGW